MKLEEHKMIKYCFISFLTLFIIIFLIDLTYYPKISKISDLDVSFNNKKVNIYGEIIDITPIKNMVFIVIKDNFGNKINAVLFDNKEIIKSSQFKEWKSKNYFFIGKITLYKGKIELIVDEIKKDL